MADGNGSTSTIAPRTGPNITAIVIILIGAFIAGLSLYRFYKTRFLFTPQTNPPPTKVEETIPPTPAPETQIYTNNTEGYSIKYAPDVKVVGTGSSVTFSKSGSGQTEGAELTNGFTVTILAKPLDGQQIRDIAVKDAENISGVGQVTKPVAESNINNAAGYSYSAKTLNDYTKYFFPAGMTGDYLEITKNVADPNSQGYSDSADDMIGTLQISKPVAAQPTPDLTPPAVRVSDQKAGSSVTISQVAFQEPGYVVIHKLNPDGTPGDVIGRSNIISNGGSNIVIQLTKSVAVGEKLAAVLHDDDGDREYDYPNNDLPIKDASGNYVMQVFNVIDP